jgi:hypothetical protein
VTVCEELFPEIYLGSVWITLHRRKSVVDGGGEQCSVTILQCDL